MAETEHENFDDPGLKAALRRVWGEERAPAALRERLLAASAGSSSQAAPARASAWRFRAPLYALAAAAMVLVAIGLAFHFSQARHGDRQSITANVLPAALADDLVARHDACCGAKDHHMPGLSRDNFALIGTELHQKLGFPILAARLPGSWDFHGASICPVGTVKSGHLVFEHAGKEFVSVFSLPRNVINAGEAGNCSQVTERHPVAGFATAAGFYCVVGSSTDGSLTLDQIRSLRDQLRPDVARAEAGTEHAARLSVAASH